MKGKINVEERAISVERTIDGVKLRITTPNGNNVLEILLPFTDAYKLGRILISESRTGMTQMELLVRKIAELEHAIHRLEDKVREMQKELKNINQLTSEENEKK